LCTRFGSFRPKPVIANQPIPEADPQLAGSGSAVSILLWSIMSLATADLPLDPGALGDFAPACQIVRAVNAALRATKVAASLAAPERFEDLGFSRARRCSFIANARIGEAPPHSELEQRGADAPSVASLR
jgi:hypothetical protein